MRDRAQLVLATAAIVAVALAPVVFAYLQLGYTGDVAASNEYDAPVQNAKSVLSRAGQDAVQDTDSYQWSDRDAAITAVRSELRPDLDTLRASRVESGTVYQVEYNQSTARAWAQNNCPRGPNRQFGDCVAERGVIVQNRGGETNVLAVAFDIRVTTERGWYEVTKIAQTTG